VARLRLFPAAQEVLQRVCRLEVVRFAGLLVDQDEVAQAAHVESQAQLRGAVND